MAEPIIEKVVTPVVVAVDFRGGKVKTDARQAKVGTNIRSNAVGVDAGDYEVILAPAGTVMVGCISVGEVKIESPPTGLLTHVSVRVNVSNANPNPALIEEEA